MVYLPVTNYPNPLQVGVSHHNLRKQTISLYFVRLTAMMLKIGRSKIANEVLLEKQLIIS